MPLVEVALPTPTAMRGRWAATAAVYAARGWGDSCFADAGVWHYDDGGGNWANLRRLDAGRAVLFGHDHEYSETYFRDAAEYLDEPETDLLAGAPSWWGQALEGYKAFGEWIGFVYGYENGVWRRADYDLDDGFASVSLPVMDEAQCRGLIGELTDGLATDAAVRALVATDGHAEESLVAAMVPQGWDVAAGVAAARRFRN
jgi:hypothetical protein